MSYVRATEWERVSPLTGAVVVSLDDPVCKAWPSNPARLRYVLAVPNIVPSIDTDGTALPLRNRPSLQQATITIPEGQALWVRGEVSHWRVHVEAA